MSWRRWDRRSPQRARRRDCTAWILPCAWALLQSGCIQLNDLYDARSQALPPPPPAPTASDSASRQPDNGTGANVEFSDGVSSLETTGAPDSGPSGTDSESTAMTDLSSSHDSTATDSTSDSDSDSGSTGGMPEPLWIPLTLHNPDPATEADALTAVRVTVDHATLVTHGAAANGSDLHLVRITNDHITPLTRVLDPGSSWNAADTVLWFALEDAIAADERDESTYFLMIHDNGQAPFDSPDDVFMLFDTFDGPHLDPARWESARGGPGTGSASAFIENGELVLESTATGSDAVTQRVRSADQWQMSGITVETSMYAFNYDSPNLCTEEFFTTFWTSYPSTTIRAAWLQSQGDFFFGNHEDVSPYNFVLQRLSGNPGTLHQYQRHVTRWEGSTVSMSRDGTLIATSSPVDTTLATPSSDAFTLGFQTASLGQNCPVIRSHLHVDWVFARRTVGQEVDISVRTGETSTGDRP